MTEPSAVASAVGRSRIFVVEDEAVIALDLMDRLRDLGYEPCGHAARSDDARRLIPLSCADLVLMDVNLGDGPDGVETARLLDSVPATPVVFLTAYSDPQLLERAARVPAAGYILKPFNDRDLRVAIDLALARRAAVPDQEPRNKSIVTTCMSCQKVRTAGERWTELEAWLAGTLGIRFSHGYCPTCFESVINDLNQRLSEEP